MPMMKYEGFTVSPVGFHGSFGMKSRKKSGQCIAMMSQTLVCVLKYTVYSIYIYIYEMSHCIAYISENHIYIFHVYVYITIYTMYHYFYRHDIPG